MTILTPSMLPILAARSLFHLLCIAVCCGVWLPPTCQSLKLETDALLEFKTHLEDPLNFLESWNATSQSPCGFRGVSCDPGTGLVIGIALGNLSLSGEISPSVARLRRLQTLSLQSNAISGRLPPELAGCARLRALNVSMNRINGTVPDLSRLRNLRLLDLSVNRFTGRFPGWVANLTRAGALILGHNPYDDGPVPRGVGNLKNLTWVDFGSSNLIGQVPEEIFEARGLEVLDLSDNKISGGLTASVAKLMNLKKLFLFANSLTGGVPPELASLSLLEEIDLSKNNLRGELPAAVGDLKNLAVFQVHSNNFSGQLPSGFGDMQHLIGVSIYGNNFSGDFPAKLGRLSPLTSIDISDNQFSGSFPAFLCEQRRLQFLLALGNNFSGLFPDTYSECKSLVRFRISKNRLSGKIPDGAWGLPNAIIIDFGDNMFTGRVSRDVGKSVSLSQLILVNNRFSGYLPKEIGSLTSLEKLYFTNNSFSGPIPPELGQLNQLSSLHFEQNSLTGSFPPELGNCGRLVDLNVAANSLSGSIPRTVSKMSSLNSLNFSGNKLTGMIPDNLGQLKLSSIDFSNNGLSGRVPADILTMGGYQAFVGNKGLCIDEDSRTPADSGMEICDGQHGQGRIFEDKLVLFFAILSALFVVLAGLLLVSYLHFRLTETMEGEKERDLNWKLESFHQLEFEEDEICKLKDENLIGIGGTGKVFRLDLKKNGTTVAVKQLRKGSGVKVLATEMEIMGKIRHKNILKLYACLVNGESSFLVFEYMAKGNLFQALHRQVKGGRPALDWYQRHKIAVGAARGIAYLHHDCSPPIIHRDIKSKNILLDDDCEPKIADFGIAKIAQESSPASVSSCFAGTHGYIAPELAYTVKATKMGDVYSFGVVLLELITGRSPIEDEYGEGKDIVYWVSSHLNNRKEVLQVVDHSLDSDVVRDDMILKVLQVAVLCTTRLPSLRPTMREVVNLLIDAHPSAVLQSHIKNQKFIL